MFADGADGEKIEGFEGLWVCKHENLRTNTIHNVELITEFRDNKVVNVTNK